VRQNAEFPDRVTEGCAEEDIGREVSAGGNARETDGGCEAIHREGHPSMMVIAVGDDGRDRESADGVAGWEAAFSEVRLAVVEECVVEGAARRNASWTFALRDDLESQIDDRAVDVSFAGEQARVDHIRIATDIAGREKGQRDEGRFRRSDRAVECVVQIVQVPGVLSKVWCDFRVSDDEAGGAPDNGQRRNPVATSGELRREEPNVFLIGKNSTRKFFP